jgi:peptide deformylase
LGNEKMSEILTIDTTTNVIQNERVEPLQLYDDSLPLLNEVMPEYKDALPNFAMNNLVKQLKLTMKLYGGIGLSANQCGIRARVFIIGTDQFQIACINPKVIKSSADLQKDNEGCLSFPALYLKIARPIWCDVGFYDESGQYKEMRLEGLTARCFLHELDHMNGVKFTSHVGPVSIQLAKQKQQKFIKKVIRQKKNNGIFV